MKFIFQPSIFRGKLLVSGRVPPTIFNKAASLKQHMDVYENSGTPKSSILIGFSIINHPFWGTPIFGNTHILQGEFLGFHLPSAESYYQLTIPWKNWPGFCHFKHQPYLNLGGG